MTGWLDPIREEQKRLQRELDGVVNALQALEIPLREMTVIVDLALAYLRSELIPHAHAEERVLAPAVNAAIAAGNGTLELSSERPSFQRAEADLQDVRRRLATVAETVSREVHAEVSAIATALRNVLAAHFKRLDETYLPALDKSLTFDQAGDLIRRMLTVSDEKRR